MNFLNNFTGIGKVFAFTAGMTTGAKGWRAITITLALILFLAPLGIMAGIEFFADEEIPYSGSIDTIYIVDETEGEWDPAQLGLFDSRFSEIKYQSWESYENALTAASLNTLVLRITLEEGEYISDIITPIATDITEEDAEHYAVFFDTYFTTVLAQKNNADMTSLMYASMPININILGDETADDVPDDTDSNGIAHEILRYALPFVTVMFMYFFVLFYGQSCAQLVVMEKTSKLMDTILVTVKPSALIFGKIFAGVLCAVFQLAVWVLSLILGLAAGGYAAKEINPDSTLDVFAMIRDSGLLDGMFTPSGVVLSLLIIVSGCLLYCSLASIGGAFAGKQEDLQSTNILFTMVLVVSFMVVMFGGNLMTTGEIATAGWMDFIPFTAVLITPSRVLLGDASALVGICSLVITLVFCGLIMLAAGRIYKMMSFYKGNPPKILSFLGKK